ncbi:YqhA family protein [Chlorobium sp. N1]|uniref:YqhA family protein n=1 Tax=Chlorobium sp. N1 TaxID=2491138 RepID=UPI00103EDD6B|nr:YqhA family protein [Chlorobium sp. N1]TCD48675.1 YqhA family protein [Chlorobium sp. N1]
MHRLLSSTRFLVILAVAALFAAAVTLLVYGAVSVGSLIVQAILSGSITPKGGKSLVLGFIESADLFLVATALYIMALGLYELFIDDTVPMPAWLQIHTLDDLKEKLVGVIVVVMAVVFLGHAITWHGESSILYFGGAVAAVTASLALFNGQKKKKDPKA